MLYECLAGERPFDRESELSVVFAHLNEPPPHLSDVRTELPQAFDAVFETALAKSPDERYSSCEELVAAARAALQGKTFVRRKLRRRRLVLAAGVVLVAAGAGIGGVLATKSDSTAASPPRITQTSIAGAKLGLTAAAYKTRFGGWRAETATDSQAPSSSAAQSCSPPPNGTNTPAPCPNSIADPVSTPTSAGERSRIAASSAGSRSASSSAVASEQHELAVVGHREAHYVASRLRARESRSPRSDLERCPTRVGGGRRVLELGLVFDQTRNDQLSPRERREHLGNRQKPVQLILVRGEHEHSSIRLCRGARAGRSRSRQVERRILPQDCPLELVERRGGLDAELVHERRPCFPVDLECLRLPT